jgi:hypothetical protein
MRTTAITRRLATGVLASAIAATGLGVAVASPAQACDTNAYHVVWPVAGVYDRMTQNSFMITKKSSGERVTGPTGLGHVYNPDNGYSWTKVWVYSVPGFREGWMRDDAVTYVGCA